MVSSKDKHHSNECPHPFLLAFIAGKMPNGMEYFFGQFGSDVLAVSPSKISLILSPLVRGKRWDSLDAVPAPLSSTKYQCVINTSLAPSAKHSALRSAVGEINSISAKPTTGERLLWQNELKAHIGTWSLHRELQWPHFPWGDLQSFDCYKEDSLWLLGALQGMALGNPCSLDISSASFTSDA